MPESLKLTDSEQTEAAGVALARAVQDARPGFLCVCLEGDLGAGKTTFSRGFLRGMGHEGRVPSPTYTLVEPYEVEGFRVYHLDLYRLQEGAELEYLGIEEMTEPGSILLVEWPSRAGDSLPEMDLQAELKVISEGRMLQLSSHSAVGERVREEFDAELGV